MAALKSGVLVVAKNRRAHFDYELGDRTEAGLVLKGSEARALRESAADVSAAWVDIDDRGEAWVKDMNIPALKHAVDGHEEKRKRKLLLHKIEAERLKARLDRDGMTLVVTQIYFKDGRAKLEFAVGRGKKRHDKRAALRERDLEKEARSAIRRAR